MLLFRHKVRFVTAIVCLCALLGSPNRPSCSGQGTPPTSDWQTFRKTVQPVLSQYCFECHADKAKGDIRLDQFTDEKALAQGATTVEKVLEVLGKHSMPPKKRPQPDGDEMKLVVSWLEAFVERREKEGALSDQVRIRRLNRAEYNNTVRDLLGVHFQPADDFPQAPPGIGSTILPGRSPCRRC